jgi:hypothetical protein
VSAFRKQPHTAVLVRPHVSVDASTNASTLSYVVPPATSRTIQGLLQTITYRQAQQAEGMSSQGDATWHTKDRDVLEADLLRCDALEPGGVYRVIAVQQKQSTRGKFDHMEVLLTREETYG